MDEATRTGKVTCTTDDAGEADVAGRIARLEQQLETLAGVVDDVVAGRVTLRQVRAGRLTVVDDDGMPWLWAGDGPFVGERSLQIVAGGAELRFGVADRCDQHGPAATIALTVDGRDEETWGVVGDTAAAGGGTESSPRTTAPSVPRDRARTLLGG